MAIDTAWASDLLAIREQLGAVLGSQEKVARAVAELRADIAPILVCSPHRPSMPRRRAPEPTPGTTVQSQNGLDSGGPAHVASSSVPAAAEPPGVARVRTRSGDSVPEAAIELAVGNQGTVGFPGFDSRQGHKRRVARFRKLLRHNEAGRWDPPRQSAGRWWSLLGAGGTRSLETQLDVVFAAVITLNTFLMALELDARRDRDGGLEVWTCLAIAFSFLFWAELFCRPWLHGPRRHFRGKEWLLNSVDALLVVTDTAQIACTLSLGRDALKGIPAASLFRLFRIFRISRVIRVLKSPVFNDLLTVVHGLRGGLVTLGWAFVPLFLVLYTASLVCRETFGRGDEENVGPYFDTVPRALLTMIRCGFGDFTSRNGVPIIEYVMSAYGLVWGFVYGVFVFFVSVGVFNVIAAVFLDSTLTVTANLQKGKLQSRLADKELWYTRTFTLVKGLLPYTDSALPDSAELSESAESVMAAEIARSDIARALQKEDMSQSLRDLDIDPGDDRILGDILDVDHTGRVSILDFVNGLQRLRGADLRRSDVLCVDLMVRSLQEKVDDVILAVRSLEGQFLTQKV